jgi:hypothetical protein
MTIIAKPWLKKFVMIGQSLVDIKRKREEMKKKGRKIMKDKDRGGGASTVKAHYMSIKCCCKVVFARF